MGGCRRDGGEGSQAERSTQLAVVLSKPDASPASWVGTPMVAASVIGTKLSPMPSPATRSGIRSTGTYPDCGPMKLIADHRGSGQQGSETSWRRFRCDDQSAGDQSADEREQPDRQKGKPRVHRRVMPDLLQVERDEEVGAEHHGADGRGQKFATDKIGGGT